MVVASSVATGLGEQAAYVVAGVGCVAVLVSWQPLRRVVANRIDVSPPSGITGLR